MTSPTDTTETLFDTGATPDSGDGGDHPAQYSPEVLAVLGELLLHETRHVHDPFAGLGHRLGRRCDTLGLTYSGTDREPWASRDPRVRVGDATDPADYPDGPFIIVTSPVYQNKRLCDYPEGPTPNTKGAFRRDYGISRGEALHPNNFARLTGRPGKRGEYYRRHGEVVEVWRELGVERALVNVDGPIAEPWVALLAANGYEVVGCHEAVTRRYLGAAAATRERAEYEVVLDLRLAVGEH